MTTQFRVDSFHINVYAGDAAIHLLVAVPLGDALPQVVSAVLMDGGNVKYASTVGCLTETIAKIEGPSLYTWPNTRGERQLFFDSVVVTHWDLDHYSGLVRLMQDNILASTVARPPPPAKWYRSISFFRYGAPGVGGILVPQTTFYAPNWNMLRLSASTARRRVVSGHDIYLSGTAVKGEGYLHILVMMDPSDRASYVKFERVAYFMTDKLPLGVDFFTGIGLRAGTTPRSVTTRLDLPNNPQPGLYCVVSNAWILGKKNRIPMIEKSAATVHVDIPEVIDVVGSALDATNHSSIVALVVWPDPQRSVSHYMGGDADWKIEDAVLSWINAGSPMPVPLPAMKLSHHGAASTTPTDFVEAMQPKKIIVSSGFSYGHPRWEILLWLYAYYRSKRIPSSLTSGWIEGRYLYPTNYPYWFARARDVPPNGFVPVPGISANALTKTFSPTRKDELPFFEFQNGVKTLYTSFEDPNNPWVAWQALGVPGPSPAQRARALQFLAELLLAVWKEMSPVGVASYPLMAASIVRSAGVGTQEILYHRVTQTSILPSGLLYAVVKTQYKTGADEVLLPDTYPALSLVPVPPAPAPVALPPVAAAAGPAAVVLDTALIEGDPASYNEPEPDPSDGIDSSGDAVEIPAVEGSQDTIPESSAITDTGIVPAPVPRKLDNGGFYFWSSRHKDEAGAAGYLGAFPVLDSVISSLASGSLALAAAPTAQNAASFLATDDMMAWLSHICVVQSLSASGTSTMSGSTVTSATLTSFNLTIVFAGLTLTFESNYALAAMGQSTVPIVPPPAVTEMQGVYPDAVILGLNSDAPPPNPPTPLTLSDVLKEVYKESPDMQPASLSFLNGLGLNLDVSGSTGQRNAIWFSPMNNYRTVQRLAFQIQDTDVSVKALADLLSLLKLSLVRSSGTVITKKSATISSSSQGPASLHTPFIALKATTNFILSSSEALLDCQAETALAPKPPPDLTFALTFNGDQVEVLLSSDGLDIEDLLTWLEAVIGQGHFQKPTFGDIFRKRDWIPKFRRIRITLDKDHVVQGVQLDMESVFNFNKSSMADDGENVAVLFTYTWNRAAAPAGGSDLKGMLWFPTDISSVFPPGFTQAMLPDWEQYEDLEPGTKNCVESVSLLNLLPDGSTLNASDIPDGIPYLVDAALFEVNSTDFTIYGSIMSQPPKKTTIPKLSFDQVFLHLQWTFAAPGKDLKGWVDVELGFELTLSPSAAGLQAGFETATLNGLIEYTTSPISGQPATWNVNASVANLCMATLYNFFDSDCQDGVMSILKNLLIVSLKLDYSYTAGAGSSFTFVGDIILGELQLTLTYDYHPQEAVKWDFSAVLSIEQSADKTTVNAIVQSIAGPDVSLPTPIGGINVPSNSSVSLKMSKTTQADPTKSPSTADADPPAKKEMLFVLVELTIGSFDLSFAQFLENGKRGESQVPKRVIAASISKLPSADIPIVSKLEQPFDEMYFLYVQDKTVAADVSGGLNQAEIDMFNANSTTQLYCNAAPPNAPTTTNLIAARCHLVLILKENNVPTVALDYVFDNPDPQSNPDDPDGPDEDEEEEEQEEDEEDEEDEEGALVLPTARAEAVRDDDPTASEPAPAMAPMGKRIGPLTISNIGLQYKTGTLSILLDATFDLGPITLSLLGLSLGLDFSGTSGNPPKPVTFDFQNLPTSVSFHLDGLAASFNRPPVVMAGLFEFRPPMYLGGLSVAVDPYMFQASGEYGVMPSGYKTVSVFADLQGPLIELEFAAITGICGGFGYNSDLTFPSSQNIVQFPFFDKTLIGGDPLTTIENMGQNNWILPTEGDFWLAAGLTCNAFQALDVQAVVAIEFSPTVKLGIFADCIVQLPKDEPEKLMYVELGIVAKVDFAGGTMAIDGTLAPTSFIFDPFCHLSGGFGLYYWFGNNANAGDWVFTIGGYHPAYTPQPYYPNPARLAISWTLDDSLSITGSAYLAITPHACMAGGSLNANLNLGPLSAFFDAWADFLINYKPFSFVGDIGVDIGVRFTLDLWICTIYISVDISGDVHIMGPPCHGYVHVDFWVFGFDIYFGQDPEPTNPVKIADFYTLVKNVAPPSSSSAAVADVAGSLGPAGTATDPPPPPAQPNDHVLTCETGLFPDPNAPQTVPPTADWSVRANTFSFSISCAVAVSQVQLAASIIPPNPAPVFYGKPMQLQHPLSSILNITVVHIADDGTSEPIKKPFVVHYTLKNVPLALWDVYIQDDDPNNTTTQDPNYITTLLDGKTVPSEPLVMGVSLIAPEAALSKDKIPKFNALDANSVPIFGTAPPSFPVVGDAIGLWLPDAPAGMKPDGSGKEDVVKQYKDVHDTWESPLLGVGAAQKAVDCWCATYMWTPPPPVVPTPPPTPSNQVSRMRTKLADDPSPWVTLPAAYPPDLVDDLAQFYLAAPMISVA